MGNPLQGGCPSRKNSVASKVTLDESPCLHSNYGISLWADRAVFLPGPAERAESIG